MKLPTTTFLASLLALTAASPLAPQRKCNGNPDLCDRRYSNVSFVGTHNSAFFAPAADHDPRVNQHLSVTGQLDAGIRFLQAQVHLSDKDDDDDLLGGVFDDVLDGISGDDDSDGGKELRLCHTDCLLYDAGTLHEYLAELKSWLDDHPDDVLTLLLVNANDAPAATFDAVFTSTSLADLAFAPSTAPDPLPMAEWPTLAQMIDDGDRLAVFLSSLPTTEASPPPYLLPEFGGYIFETPFETTDPSFPSCALHRPAGSEGDGEMMLVNHFLQREVLPDVLVPDVEAAGETNSPGSLGAHVQRCEGEWGRRPNFVLVDFFERGGVGGGVFEVQGALNG